MLEEEVYSHSSPIWSQDYLAGVPGGQIPIHTGSAHTQGAAVLQPALSRVASHCVLRSLVISALPVARPLYYSTSPLSVDASTCGSVSPARKAASQLEPNPGMKDTPVLTHRGLAASTCLRPNCLTANKRLIETLGLGLNLFCLPNVRLCL